MTPTNREELIEVMRRTAHARLLESQSCFQADVCRTPPCACSDDIALDILTALDTAGIALVPKVATEEMLIAVSWREEYSADADDWRMFLSASPFIPISSALPHLTKSTEQHGGGE